MRTFHFDLYECGSELADTEGQKLPSLDIARRNAIAAARDVMAAEVMAGRLCVSCHIVIRASSGEILDKIPFHDAVVISGL